MGAVLAPELLAEDVDDKGGARAPASKMPLLVMSKISIAAGHEQGHPSGGRGVGVGIGPQCGAPERQAAAGLRGPLRRWRRRAEVRAGQRCCAASRGEAYLFDKMLQRW